MSHPSTRDLLLFLLVATATVCGASYASAADFAVLHNGFSIRHERREVVGSVTRLYLNADPNGYVDVPTTLIECFEPDPSPRQPIVAPSQSLPDVVNTASGRYHLDPDLVNSVIHAESGFNAHAVSPKGAQGLMQLMPQTASRLGVADAFDPGANVEGGTRYLRELLQRYHFDLIKALAAYNAGPQRVDQYHGVPPYYETQAYIARVVHDFNRKKLAEQKAAASKHAVIKRAALLPASNTRGETLGNTQPSVH
ncbi:MAG: lytic transglycosylase domain-containing protein [Terriglobales bacterium]